MMRKRYLQISIHTSAREVTKYGKKAIYHLDDFNPHFRKGSDRKGPGTNYAKTDFNPHFRKGSDFSAFSIVFCSSISIHTSAREVTEWASFSDLIKNISIHTSAREVTDILIRPPPCLKFQSTLPQGK